MSFDLTRLMDDLPLRRLGREEQGGLCLSSLPLPRGAGTNWNWGGRAGWCHGLGQWVGEPTGNPRRLLIAADGGTTPERLNLAAGESPTSDQRPPEADMAFLYRNPEELPFWEKHALRIEWGGRSVEIVMGLRHKGEIHWWEACRLVVLSESAFCREIEMGGSIPVEEYTLEAYKDGFNYKDPYLHRHNWLNGRIHARLYANGVCEFHAHHINSKFFDDGLSFDDVVPVIAVRTHEGETALHDLPKTWDGSQSEMSLGGVAFDWSEVSRLATPKEPGRWDVEKGFAVLQPYAGVSIFGGLCPQLITGDPYAIHSSERKFPRGLARTLRFSLSLSPERSPKIVRYLAPAWWYGLCEEFAPESLLPVSDEYDRGPESSADWLMKSIQRGGFEDGCAARHEHADMERPEPGWEGEVPYAQFLAAWRRGKEEDYLWAMRSAYYVTDVVFDHASKTARMHGYAPPYAFSVPMNRIHGLVAAYLETGDPYLIETAKASTDQTYWIHKNSWPRNTVGRDACFIRGAMMLYRFFGEDHYRNLARDAITDVIASQRPDGSFGDQAGGTGIHQWGHYITKPWMGCMAIGGALDYLEFFPEDKEASDLVMRFADWLMKERGPRPGDVTGWTYQHNFNGGTRFLNYKTGAVEELLPTDRHWHQDYFARILFFASKTTGNPEYFEAWEESFRVIKEYHIDHASAQAIQFVPPVQARLWNAHLNDQGELTTNPLPWGKFRKPEATVLTPKGPTLVHLPH